MDNCFIWAPKGPALIGLSCPARQCSKQKSLRRWPSTPQGQGRSRLFLSHPQVCSSRQETNISLPDLGNGLHVAGKGLVAVECAIRRFSVSQKTLRRKSYYISLTRVFVPVPRPRAIFLPHRNTASFFPTRDCNPEILES